MSADTENKWLLKHTGSSLRDSYVIVKIDEETKTVELISEQFDSVHIIDFVLNVLTKYGVNAALDESDCENTRRPDWHVIYILGGVEYKCLVAVIPEYGKKSGTGKKTTVTLRRFVEV